ncbi:neuraminidase (sialidase)-like protein [candidate division KSB1 bacterium]|nr:neuraminidase (sialidase)-like protein [candidate division KSB1 bacterium]
MKELQKEMLVSMRIKSLLAGLFILLTVSSVFSTEKDEFQSQLIFPLLNQHVHGATVVECPNGDMLAAWFQGSGEKDADDVAIYGARLRKNGKAWSEPFVMVDVPGFPDVNPIMFIDPQKRLWLFWYMVMANQWESSLPRYIRSGDYLSDGPPKWEWQDVIIFKPGGSTSRGIQPNDPFVTTIERKLNELHDHYFKPHPPSDPAELKTLQDMFAHYEHRWLTNARGEDMMRMGRIFKDDGTYEKAELGFPLIRRIGWQTKNKPILLDQSRLVVPYYSDEFSFSIMAITDDWGKTWMFSEPLAGPGSVQPCLLRKNDGTLVAYMRDNGPPPKRIQMSESSDNGLTWSMVQDSDLPNPAAGTDAVTLQNGHWAIVYNDSEKDRFSLAISISTDEGKTWPWTRHLEHEKDTTHAEGEYPAIIQGKDGLLHIVYSYAVHEDSGKPNKTIKYVRLSESWVRNNR